MRWVVLMVLLAGCAASVEEPPKPTKILLLGADACHEGICYRGVHDGPFLDLLALEEAPGQVRMVDQGIAWTDSRGAWYFDRPSRELRLLADEPTTIFSFQGRLYLQSNAQVWTWDAPNGDRQDIQLQGVGELLGVFEDGYLILGASEGNATFTVYGWGGVAASTFEPGAAPGPAAAATAAHNIYWLLDSPGEGSRVWRQAPGLVAPIWSGASMDSMVHAGGYIYVGGARMFHAISTFDGDTDATIEGRLLGVAGGRAMYVRHGEFGQASVDSFEPGSGSITHLDLHGRAVLQADVSDNGTLYALSGAERTLSIVA